MTDTNPDDYIDRYFPVLDHGAVALTGYLGGDEKIEQFARVSYGKGTRKRTKTRGLLRYLMRNLHTSPFESVQLQFHVILPLFVARQKIRHRTFSFNEYSGRHSLLPEAFYVPDKFRYGAQSKKNRQGTSEEEDPGMSYGEFRQSVTADSQRLFQRYHDYAENDVARELARINLPLNAYTEWYCSVDLHNLFHFLKLRLDSHSQWEIQQYAEVMAGLAAVVAPLAFEAFVDYQLRGYKCSGMELDALRDICQGGRVNEDELEGNGMSKREIEEFKTAMFGEVEDRVAEDFQLDLSSSLTPEQARVRLHGESFA